MCFAFTHGTSDSAGWLFGQGDSKFATAAEQTSSDLSAEQLLRLRTTKSSKLRSQPEAAM